MKPDVTPFETKPGESPSSTSAGVSAAHAKVQWLTITEAHAGQRIDNFLVTLLKGVPKSAIYRVLRKGEVRINKKRSKPDYKLALGDVVRVPPLRVAERESIQPHGAALAWVEGAILYESPSLIVLNKPSGIAVHGGSGVSFGVIEALRALRGENQFLELVHRLDRDTSGCLMIAKKRSQLTQLHALLKQGDMEKCYLALLTGRWRGRQHRVDAPLDKYQLGGERMVRVARDGKPSVTEFQVLKQFPGATLVEARPITGRTHQIRVHAQHVGHPIAGDDKYTPRELSAPLRTLGLKRLFLHAARLRVPAIDLDVEAPLPEDLESLLRTLSQQAAEQAGRLP